MNAKTYTAILSLLIAASCATRRNAVHYSFPAEMSTTVRDQYMRDWQKGKALYEENCARCHNTKKGRREHIPIFPADKLAGYGIRLDNADHERALPETRVTTDELVSIITFLSYKVHTINDTVRQH
ncbi:MAG: cytochrome c [Chitinophagaceae bacterium]|nr:cytochrome c [Chitinophagaceae bacterium]